MMIGWIVVGVVVLVTFGLYNSLIGAKNAVEKAFGSVDALLKKRYDLIPNLIATVKQYMQHEAGTLTQITELRTKAISPGVSDNDKIALSNQIGKALGGIMVAVENYPDLKASQNFAQLQGALNEVEEQISAARRAYNAAVTDYNNAIEMFPTNIFAGMMGYQRKAVLETPEAERANVNVGQLFKS